MTPTKIHRISFTNVNGYLLSQGDNMVLFDTGHFKTTHKLYEKLDELGLKPEQIGLIILSHTHFDHAGGAADIKSNCKAPLIVHSLEEKYLKKGYKPYPPGTRWKGKLIAGLGSVFARKLAHYPPIEADLVMDAEFPLQDYGISGKLIHSPGHTQGSVSLILEDGRALVGDNILGIPRHCHFPPFAHDIQKVVQTWELYQSLELRELYPAHGPRMTGEDLDLCLKEVRKKYPKL